MGTEIELRWWRIDDAAWQVRETVMEGWEVLMVAALGMH